MSETKNSGPELGNARAAGEGEATGPELRHWARPGKVMSPCGLRVARQLGQAHRLNDCATDPLRVTCEACRSFIPAVELRNPMCKCGHPASEQNAQQDRDGSTVRLSCRACILPIPACYTFREVEGGTSPAGSSHTERCICGCSRVSHYEQGHGRCSNDGVSSVVGVVHRCEGFTLAGSSSASTPALTPLERDLLEALREIAFCDATCFFSDKKLARLSTTCTCEICTAFRRAQAAIARAEGR